MSLRREIRARADSNGQDQ